MSAGRGAADAGFGDLRRLDARLLRLEPRPIAQGCAMGGSAPGQGIVLARSMRFAAHIFGGGGQIGPA